MKFSADRAWADMVAMFTAHREILLAIMGVFVFLPALAWSLMIPAPDLKADGINNYANMMAWWNDNAPWYVVRAAIELVGTATIFGLLLGRGQPTVIEALRRTAVLLPSLLLTNLLVGLIQFPGLLLLVVPAIYAIGRTMLSNAIVVAEDIRNPIAAVSRSFALTHGNGWRLAAMFFLIVIVGFVITAAVSSVFGALLAIALPENAAAIGDGLIESVLTSAMTMALILLIVAVYRQLSVQPSRSISGT